LPRSAVAAMVADSKQPPTTTKAEQNPMAVAEQNPMGAAEQNPAAAVAVAE
jgi:hypothetical protein